MRIWENKQRKRQKQSHVLCLLEQCLVRPASGECVTTVPSLNFLQDGGRRGGGGGCPQLLVPQMPSNKISQLSLASNWPHFEAENRCCAQLCLFLEARFMSLFDNGKCVVKKYFSSEQKWFISFYAKLLFVLMWYLIGHFNECVHFRTDLFDSKC